LKLLFQHTLCYIFPAAHCVRKLRAETFIVRAGEWDTATKNEPMPHSDHRVKKVVIHPEFNSRNLINDIALFFLSGEVPNEKHIGTVCLPPANQSFYGNRCFVSGWGTKSFSKEEKFPSILKKLELPVISRESCENNFSKALKIESFNLHNSSICAIGDSESKTRELSSRPKT
jgi:secreted trypsin-like serine protease